LSKITRQEGLEHAKKFGADSTLFPNEVRNESKVLDWEDIGRGVDITVEASGTQAGLELAEEMTAAHGTLSILGYLQSHDGMRQLNLKRCNWKAISLINAHERRNSVHIEMMKSGLRMIEAGKFNMKDMVTHVFGLNEVDLAYKALQEKPVGFIKSVIRISY
jgi:threonine dehydrogenase-like Zn-dependent dehydrogenase